MDEPFRSRSGSASRECRLDRAVVGYPLIAGPKSKVTVKTRLTRMVEYPECAPARL